MQRLRRTGYEPVQARSPLRMRLALAVCGVVWGAAAAAGFAVYHQPGWAALCAAIAAVACLDTVLVIRRIRQGPHFQPGRSIPPYRPVDPGPDRGSGRDAGRPAAHGRRGPYDDRGRRRGPTTGPRDPGGRPRTGEPACEEARRTRAEPLPE